MNELITIKALKELLASRIGDILSPEGYVIDKKNTAFQRKDQFKNKIKMSFDCYDYAPARIEFRLLFFLNIPVIDAMMERYYQYCGENYSKQWATIILSEGDFHPQTKNLEHKLRNAATHIIIDSASLESEVEVCIDLLRSDILPGLNKFLSLEEFQRFIIGNHDLITHLNLIIPSLIALKLNGKDNLLHFVDFIRKKLNLDTKPKHDLMRKLVDNIIPFSP